MKNKKTLKIIWSASAVGVLTTVTSFATVSCGNHKTPAIENTWEEFSTLALGESPENIAKLSTNAPSAWSSLSDSDFTFITKVTITDKYTLEAKISSKTQGNWAKFKIVYKSNDKYNVSKWECTVPPLPPETDWNTFKTNAIAESAEAIVKNASTQANGWNQPFKKGDFNIQGSITPHETTSDKSLTAYITSASKNEYAIFTIEFHDNKYDVKNWNCTSQPQPNNENTWDKFVEEAIHESPVGIVKNAFLKARNWQSATSSQLSFKEQRTPNNALKTITAKILNISRKEEAIFTIEYKSNDKYSSGNWECTTQPFPETENSWTEFKKHALAATPKEIVGYSNPAAKNWDNLPDGDLAFYEGTLPVADETKHAVTVKIISIERSEVATFTIQYVDRREYVLKDWQCTSQPTPSAARTWDNFATAALAATAAEIVKNASIKANGWDSLPDGDVYFETHPSADNTKKIVTAKIWSSSQQSFAIFTATFIKDIRYSSSVWECITQPVNPPNEWDKYVSEVADALNTNQKIVKVFKRIFSQKKNTSEIPPNWPTYWGGGPESDEFISSLSLSSPKIDKVNRTVSYTVRSLDTAKFIGTANITARQDADNSYEIEDFDDISGFSNYKRWYISAKRHLENLTSDKEYNILSNYILDSATTAKTPNLKLLYSRYKGDRQNLVYARIEGSLSALKEDDQSITFNVSILLKSNDKALVTGAKIIIEYSADLGTNFYMQKLYSHLSIIHDSTPPATTTIDPFEMYR